MSGLLDSQRFGKPQLLAGFLLLVFVAECVWLVGHQSSASVSPEEISRVQQGVGQLHGHGIAGTAPVPELADMGGGPDRDHSPLWYLIASAPVALFGVAENSWAWPWLTRLQYIAFGSLLGASVWYVSRRLYGNAGGYIALSLYCFSPAVIRSSALWASQPNIAATWGTFGAVFTAIAVSHTLYAPREVILWNWRRIMLLGISLALALGSQYSLAIMVPVLLLLMLYVAPTRRGAATAILASACMISLLLVFAAFFFHPRIFWHSLADARWLDATVFALKMKGAYLQALREVIASGPVLALLVPAAVVTYVAWPRTRYFGNTAPLLVALLFLGLRVLSPHEAESVFALAAVIFLFVFVAGIAADLLETKAREPVLAVVAGLLAANGLWNLINLARIRP
jgi:hypothetical protein